MTRNSLLILTVAVIVVLHGACATPPPPLGPAERVGVYDSRVVAFAHFWSAPFRQQRDALMAEANAEKKAGHAQRADELVQRIKEEGARSHLQVFSTAPADEAMAALKDKLPAIQQELGVVRLVSQWDETALKHVPAAQRVDATDRLALEFQPDERRQRTIAKMKTTPPLARWKARLMLLAGGL